MYIYICIYIYIYLSIYLSIYIYIYREREGGLPRSPPASAQPQSRTIRQIHVSMLLSLKIPFFLLLSMTNYTFSCYYLCPD